MAKKQTGTERAKQIGPRKLKDLVDAYDAAKAGKRRIGKSFSDLKRSQVEHEHLNGPAFDQAMKERDMEAPDLADYLDALEYYRDQLGILDRAKSAPRLPLGGDSGEEEAEDEGREEAA